MKIVHYVKRMCLEDGGVVRAVLDLCGALAAASHDVTLLTLDDSDIPDSWRRGDGDGVPVVKLLKGNASPFPRLDRASLALAAREFDNADAIHLHVPWDPRCAQLGRVARRVGAPYAISLHGMLDDWCMDLKPLKKRAYLALGGRRFLEQAAAVFATAQAEDAQSSKWYPRGRGEVVPLIFDQSDYEQLPGAELAREKLAEHMPADGVPILLFLSRIHHKKHIDVLIQATGKLRDEGVSCKLLIAGTGDSDYEQTLRDLVGELHLEDEVAFVGFISGREKVSLYQAADLFVLPTHQENWGFVLVESMACGTPVITTKGVDIWPELEASGGALIIEPTVTQIAEAVRELLDDRSRLEAMSRMARSWVFANLSVDQVVKRYEQSYRDLAQPRASSSA